MNTAREEKKLLFIPPESSGLSILVLRTQVDIPAFSAGNCPNRVTGITMHANLYI